MTRRKAAGSKKSSSTTGSSKSGSRGAKRDQPAPTLMVKFARGADPALHAERLAEMIGSEHLEQAEQLFPGDLDEDLASIYEVTLRKRGSLGKTVAALQKEEEIEYAHEPASREIP